MSHLIFIFDSQNEEYHILLQNENGPCPLLAAGNVLILKKSITLPSNCVKAGVVTIEQLTNILAEKILSSNHDSDSRDFHINEVLKIFPNLQFGMDVNVRLVLDPEWLIDCNCFFFRFWFRFFQLTISSFFSTNR